MKRAAVALLALLAGCSKTPAPVTGAAPSRATLELGRKVYNYRCYFCHGYAGDAKTLASTYLAPAPRSFVDATPAALPRAAIERALREGRAGTAMKSFAGIVDEQELGAVAAFVFDEFVVRKAPNTAYHTPENGWRDHGRFRGAFAFATGEIALDTPWEQLTPAQVEGKRLFLSSCVSCHDRARVADEGPAWSTRPLSYPRAGFVFDPAAPVDAVSGASVYAKHDIAPRLVDLSARQKQGERLYQQNCAFCHAADGTGMNWIGRFMEPPARDLTRFTAETMPQPRLVATIRDGLDGTSMPAWRDVLSPAEIEAIADYVGRAFFRRADRDAVAAAPDR
ncbi:c-type cytochrome [Betaproteobacteria bacterium PRO7]|jgi:cytochrome c oxidase cbb3-type subunit 3|nr:c-type cytochrome [Betaproteobacteria bacterium PRO7]GIL07037.1 MAG: hypothetical protein BroJett031_35570 [Betaproteobacteria bacterium]